jgi:hypothetical protein
MPPLASSDASVDQLDAMIDLFVDEYEAAGPTTLAPRVVRQRRAVDALLSGHQLPTNGSGCTAPPAAYPACSGT